MTTAISDQLNDANDASAPECLGIWEQCLHYLQADMPQQEFNQWIRPLQAEIRGNHLYLYAPNAFVVDWILKNLKPKLMSVLSDVCGAEIPKLILQTGCKPNTTTAVKPIAKLQPIIKISEDFQHNLNREYTVDNFVEGKSNQLARAAILQVGDNPGTAYNPLFLYGGVGLGKTHLMHALGNRILQHKPNAKIFYTHAERFVAEMVKALQRNSMNEFKRFYRSLDTLLIDDIQFFAGKDRSQEELFHTFNALLDENQQIVLTCDKYPKEITGLEERLKSRFGWGLTVAIEPPELETRVAILMTKAEQSRLELPHEVAFFIAKRIQSNVRELEGALKRVIANAHFTGQPITLDFTREALKDLLAIQAKLVSIDNIQKTVAEYYKIKMTDLLSKRRSRFLARARQMAMAMAKELTNHSLPEIGEAFGGRDHTTVLHACRKIKELIGTDLDIKEDHMNLLRILST